MSHKLHSQSGQTILEYVLMTGVVASVFLAIMQVIDQSKLGLALVKPLKTSFAAVYQLGNVKAKDGPDGTEYHPRMPTGANNFRIFVKDRK